MGGGTSATPVPGAVLPPGDPTSSGLDSNWAAGPLLGSVALGTSVSGLGHGRGAAPLHPSKSYGRGSGGAHRGGYGRGRGSQPRGKQHASGWGTARSTTSGWGDRSDTPSWDGHKRFNERDTPRGWDRPDERKQHTYRGWARSPQRDNDNDNGDERGRSRVRERSRSPERTTTTATQQRSTRSESAPPPNTASTGTRNQSATGEPPATPLGSRPIAPPIAATPDEIERLRQQVQTSIEQRTAQREQLPEAPFTDPDPRVAEVINRTIRRFAARERDNSATTPTPGEPTKHKGRLRPDSDATPEREEVEHSPASSQPSSPSPLSSPEPPTKRANVGGGEEDAAALITTTTSTTSTAGTNVQPTTDLQRKDDAQPEQP